MTLDQFFQCNGLLYQPQQVLAFLNCSGLIKAEDVLGQQWRFFSQSRRNINHMVVNGLGEGFFIKQAQGKEQHWSIDRERQCLEHIRNINEAHGITPEFVSWHAARGILCCKVVKGAVAFSHFNLRGGKYYKTMASSLAQSLACLHTLPVPDFKPFPLPWILAIHTPTIHQLGEFSQSMRKFVMLIQSQANLCEALEHLATSWEQNTFIHADLKWDNILFHRPSKKKRYQSVIADWETSGPGDKHWDLGSVIGEYLHVWVQSIVNSKGVIEANEPIRARVPFSRILPNIKAFLKIYRSLHDCDPLRATQFAAVRLLQFLYETHRSLNDYNEQSALELQLAANLLTRPLEASMGLLGLRDE
ncbi:MAG: phosphotransferase [Candidatus Brocadiaceae bacterium]|nr:phosphotransferase [Candidatus Brocadiaceae bacterium]